MPSPPPSLFSAVVRVFLQQHHAPDMLAKNNDMAKLNKPYLAIGFTSYLYGVLP